MAFGPVNVPGKLTVADIGAAAANHSHSGYASSSHSHTAAQVGAVPTSRKVNGKALSADISLTASDVGAAAANHSHTAAQVGAVPTTCKINGKALSGDISISASDVGAAAANHSHTGYAASSHSHTAADVGAAAANHSHSGYVPTSRKINGMSLSGDITLSPCAIGAAERIHTHSAEDFGALSISGGKMSGSISFKGDDSIGIRFTNSSGDEMCVIKAEAGSEKLKIVSNRVDFILPPDTTGQPPVLSINGVDFRSAIKAAAVGHSHTASDVGAVPTSRKVNGKVLSADITLTAEDVGAASTTSVSNISSSLRSSSLNLGASTTASGGSATAVGSGAKAQAFGSTALGAGAIAQKDQATALGYNASVQSMYSTALGYKANVPSTSSNTIQLGDSSGLSALKCKVALTVTSDERDKTDITDMRDGAVEFLKKIKAVRYLFNGRSLYIPDEKLRTETDRDNLAKFGLCAYDKDAHAAGTKKGGRMRVGVLAQQVQQALLEVYGDSSYGNIVDDNLFDVPPEEIPPDVENQLSVNYSGFVPFLIKAIQELDGRLKKLEGQHG